MASKSLIVMLIRRHTLSTVFSKSQGNLKDFAFIPWVCGDITCQELFHICLKVKGDSQIDIMCCKVLRRNMDEYSKIPDKQTLIPRVLNARCPREVPVFSTPHVRASGPRR
jgi:hypothetical protein